MPDSVRQLSHKEAQKTQWGSVHFELCASLWLKAAENSKAGAQYLAIPAIHSTKSDTSSVVHAVHRTWTGGLS